VLVGARLALYLAGMAQAPGPSLPDFTFVRPDGTAFSLSSVSVRAVVLIFLRHLG
jgi:hypothetical protein